MNVKTSMYNLITTKDNINYIFNTNSGSQICLDNNDFKMLMTLFSGLSSNKFDYEPYLEIINVMSENGFLVDKDFNEFLSVQDRYVAKYKNNSSLRVTIVPTLSCNMKCYYCYEGTKKNDADWQLENCDVDNIVDFVESKLTPNSDLIIHWFGGEPLLNVDLINAVSKKLIAVAKLKDVNYYAWVTSNCYLLTPEVTKRLSNALVSKIQVTFDGSRKTHDKVRNVMATGDGCQQERIGSFDAILENIKYACDFFDVVVRVHVSPRNINDTKDLIHTLSDEGLADKINRVQFHFIENFDQNNRDVSHRPKAGSYYSKQEFAEIEVELLEIAKECGFRFKYPLEHAYGCIADDPKGFIIDADGSVKKCDHYVGEPNSGFSTIFDKDKINNISNLKRWEFNRFEDPICTGCSLFPVCLQGCMHTIFNSNETEDKCPSLKYNWQHTLPFYYNLDKGKGTADRSLGVTP